jgi:tetratricopeptide (TPR) repeat protein
VTRRRLAAAGALLLLAGTGCRRAPAAPEGGAAADPLAGARALVEERKYDEAIAAIGDQSDAEALCLLGQAWAGKAQAAPVPTPVPGSHGWSPMKPEESQALAFLERAVASRPDLAPAHLAIADLLAPHALAASRRGGAPAGNSSVSRVLESYGRAMQADPAGTAAVESMIRFAMATGRVADADGAFQELVRRRREDPDVLVRYGDFLAGPGRNLQGALAQYSQELIWRPDDTRTRLKIAAIHLSTASTFLSQKEYAAAEARLQDAKRFVVDPSSPEAARLREMQGQLAEIRGR